MSASEIPRIGLLFTSFVEFIVVVSALALVVFLLGRWKSSDIAMRVYMIFWLFMMFVWMASMTRYIFVSFGFENTTPEHWLSIITQVFIFLSGPVLFYFVGIRTLQMKPRAAFMFSIPSLLLTLWSLVILLGTDGISTVQINYFSADSVISKKLFYIFGVEVVILLAMLAYDVFLHFTLWYKNTIFTEKYRALHSLAIIAYLVLGTIDQSKIVVDWPLVVFRALYSASFLFVYVVISNDFGGRETYLITKEQTQKSGITV